MGDMNECSLRRSSTEIYPIFSGAPLCPPKVNAEFNGDRHLNAASATLISYAYVRSMPSNLEHKLHTGPPFLQPTPGKNAVVAQESFFSNVIPPS